MLSMSSMRPQGVNLAFLWLFIRQDFSVNLKWANFSCLASRG